MEANDGPTDSNGHGSPLKDVDESIGAALEPQMEIRENGSDDENTNDKLVVAQGSDWGEEDYSYSGARGFVLQMLYLEYIRREQPTTQGSRLCQT